VAARAPSFDDAKIHLNVYGQEHVVEARVRVGPARPVDVIPLAHKVADALTDIVVRDAVERGEPPACHAGCSACCRLYLPPIAPLEALALARLVKAMPGKQRETVRRRFSAAVRRLEQVGLLDPQRAPGSTVLRVPMAEGKSNVEMAGERYRAAGITCPFLESDRCSIYAERPVACRQHLVISEAALCSGTDPDVVKAVPRPVQLLGVLLDHSAALGDVDPLAMPLPLALEWAEVYAEALEGEVRGEDLLEGLMDRIEAT
jgi:Fe-S-cluster containining protein